MIKTNLEKRGHEREERGRKDEIRAGMKFSKNEAKSFYRFLVKDFTIEPKTLGTKLCKHTVYPYINMCTLYPTNSLTQIQTVQ